MRPLWLSKVVFHELANAVNENVKTVRLVFVNVHVGGDPSRATYLLVSLHKTAKFLCSISESIGIPEFRL